MRPLCIATSIPLFVMLCVRGVAASSVCTLATKTEQWREQKKSILVAYDGGATCIVPLSTESRCNLNIDNLEFTRPQPYGPKAQYLGRHLHIRPQIMRTEWYKFFLLRRERKRRVGQYGWWGDGPTTLAWWENLNDFKTAPSSYHTLPLLLPSSLSTLSHSRCHDSFRVKEFSQSDIDNGKLLIVWTKLHLED